MFGEAEGRSRLVWWSPGGSHYERSEESRLSLDSLRSLPSTSPSTVEGLRTFDCGWLASGARPDRRCRCSPRPQKMTRAPRLAT